VASILRPLGKKVKAIVNYDNFDISTELIDNYMDMVKLITDEFYLEVRRYTTSTFMRMKMGESLKERSMSPHMYETLSEASAALK
jgi:propionate CoA-transferase